MSNLGLDEIWYALLKIMVMRDFGREGWLDALNKDKDIVKRYMTDIEEITHELLEIPNLVLVEVTVENSLNALNIMKEYGLFPRDAIHASAAISSGAGTIITTDPDFTKIRERVVYVR